MVTHNSRVQIMDGFITSWLRRLEGLVYRGCVGDDVEEMTDGRGAWVYVGHREWNQRGSMRPSH